MDRMLVDDDYGVGNRAVIDEIGAGSFKYPSVLNGTVHCVLKASTEVNVHCCTGFDVDGATVATGLQGDCYRLCL